MPARVDINATLNTLNPATRAGFLSFHRENPGVWREFERFALDAARAGRQHYGAKSIMERVRWECEIAHGSDFKCNNNWTAYYARIFAAKYPEYSGIFEFREARGLKAA